jgi:hypothetical protein
VDELAEEVYNAIKKEGFVFKTVGIKVKFDDFTVQTRAKTFRSFHSDLNTLRKTAKDLMGVFIGEKGKGEEKGKKIRLVGVRVSQLSMVDEKQRLRRIDISSRHDCKRGYSSVSLSWNRVASSITPRFSQHFLSGMLDVPFFYLDII